MLGYVTVGTNDLERAKNFFDPLMEDMGQQQLMSMKGMVLYGVDISKPKLMITRPENRQSASNGNGVMVALAVQSKDDVDRLHKKALDMGAENEGDPGVRPAGLYCAYFRDPDGNKFNFHAMG